VTLPGAQQLVRRDAVGFLNFGYTTPLDRPPFGCGV
jgi:hypothetical protein